MSDDQDFMLELQKEFLNECSFLLEECEESYLRLEEPSVRAEELAKIFRCAHSLKGGGAAVGFKDLSEFAHKVEDCLSILRTYTELVTPEIISLLLQCGDALKERIESLRNDPTSSWNPAELAKRVQETTAMLSGQQPEAAAPVGASHAPPTTPVIEEVTHASEAASAIPFDEPSKVEQSVEAAQPPPAVTPGPVPAAAPANEGAPNLAPSKAGTPAAAASNQGGSVKVDIDRIDNVLDMVGELVVIKSQLMTRSSYYGSDLELNAIVSLLDKTVRELQDRALSMRMTSLKPLFLKNQRIVRDLSMKLGKPVDFIMSGEDTELDRTMVELIGDPLLHIIRNAVDHGIESPDKRRGNNKPEKGTVHLSAAQEGSRIVITIRDDGGGIHRDKVLAKAKANGLIPANRELSSIPDSEAFAFIFAAGFSTAEVVSDVSGRGVGLDVVKTNIEKLRGSIEINSEVGKGTLFQIRLPLTTSITDGMMISVRGETYIVPMSNIRDLAEVDDTEITEISRGHSLVRCRERLIPLIITSEHLAAKQGAIAQIQRKKKIVVIVEHGTRLFALQVDSLLGQTQVVLKSLSQSFDADPSIAGAAILGDGKVALVLDINHFATAAWSREGVEAPLKAINENR